MPHPMPPMVRGDEPVLVAGAEQTIPEPFHILGHPVVE